MAEPCTTEWHQQLKASPEFGDLRLIGIQKFDDDDEVLELRDCPRCHSTLAKSVRRSKENPTSLLRRLMVLRPQIVAAAQAEYDAWDPDSDPEYGDPEVGGGGICDAVANAMGDVLASAGVDQMDGGQDGDDHAFIIAYDEKDAYVVDIPPGVYERGSGYSWKKIKGVTIRPTDVVLEKINRADLELEDA